MSPARLRRRQKDSIHHTRQKMMFDTCHEAQQMICFLMRRDKNKSSTLVEYFCDCNGSRHWHVGHFQIKTRVGELHPMKIASINTFMNSDRWESL